MPQAEPVRRMTSAYELRLQSLAMTAQGEDRTRRVNVDVAAVAPVEPVQRQMRVLFYAGGSVTRNFRAEQLSLRLQSDHAGQVRATLLRNGVELQSRVLGGDVVELGD